MPRDRTVGPFRVRVAHRRVRAWGSTISTTISWSDHGEQGVVSLAGAPGVVLYRIIYGLLIVGASSPHVRDELSSHLGENAARAMSPAPPERLS